MCFIRSPITTFDDQHFSLILFLEESFFEKFIFIVSCVPIMTNECYPLVTYVVEWGKFATSYQKVYVQVLLYESYWLRRLLNGHFNFNFLLASKKGGRSQFICDNSLMSLISDI